MIRPAITFTSTLKTPDDVARMIASRPAFFTTTDGSQGFATCSQFRGGDVSAPCMKHSVILSPMARGHGLGRALLMAIEDHARSHGAHQMIAGISGENPAAIRFHQALVTTRSPASPRPAASSAATLTLSCCAKS